MRVAVVGAGIVGLCTAYELATDGHDVSVYERNASVASEASFAHAGLLAPALVSPWSAPGSWSRWIVRWLTRDPSMRAVTLPSVRSLAWLRHAHHASTPSRYQALRAALLDLARASADRTDALARRHGIEHQRSQGLLMLLRGERDVTRARRKLERLSALGVKAHLLDAQAARRAEPALHAHTALSGAIHFPDALAGNCRQFAQAMRTILAEIGVPVHLGANIAHVGTDLRLTLSTALRGAGSDDAIRAPHPHKPPSCGASHTTSQTTDPFDSVVLCTAGGTLRLLDTMNMALPLQTIHGYSITMPLRPTDALHDTAPRAALLDERYQVSITRLGDRVRVCGGIEIGVRSQSLRRATLATLYRVLEDWFPGAARPDQALEWKGGRPTLPDGLPLIGASAIPGLWLNTGHGAHGWALACGSAKLLADLLAQRTPSVAPEPFSPMRW